MSGTSSQVQWVVSCSDGDVEVDGERVETRERDREGEGGMEECKEDERDRQTD